MANQKDENVEPGESENRSEDNASDGWLPSWIGEFFYQAGKIAVALSMTGVIIGIGVLGYLWYEDVQKERRMDRLRKAAEKFTDPVKWRSQEVGALGGAKFDLETKWIPGETYDGEVDYQNGKLKYKLDIDGYTGDLKRAWESEFTSDYSVTVHFLGEDDFRITSIEIALNEMTRTVNSRGQGIGFSVQGEKTIPLEEYRRFHHWDITWNL